MKIDGNEYQNYFMIIKSDKPMREMNIKNTLTDLPVYAPPQQVQIQEAPVPQEQPTVESYEEPSSHLEIKIAIAIFVLALGGYLLHHFNKSKSSNRVRS